MKFVAHPTARISAALAVALIFLGCKADLTRAAQQEPAAAAPAAAIESSGTNAVSTVPVPVEKLVTAPETLSPGVADIINLAEGGLSDTVIIAFIESWPHPFHLSAEEVLYLTDLGLSEDVIAAMIKHQGSDAAVAATTESSAAAAQSAAAQPPSAPAADPYASEGTQSGPSVAITATPEFEAGVRPAPEAVVATSPEVVPPVQYSHFYTALAPYGSWIEVADYGVCWRPTVAVVTPGWRPYSHRGRWMYTDHGWYWQSDYSWGWAPFHYGRWALHPHHGWIWAPDHVWGPAWVTWRYSDAYCGWAPLPPGAYVTQGVGFTYHRSRVSFSFGFGLGYSHYTFLPMNRFCDRTPWNYYLPSTQIVNVYNRTKIINKIYINENKTVVNEGIDRDHVAAVTRAEIRKVSVRELSGAEHGARPDRLTRRGSELVVYRPQLPAAGSTTPVRRAGGDATLVPSRPSSALVNVPRATDSGAGQGGIRSELSSKTSDAALRTANGVRVPAGAVSTIPSRPIGNSGAQTGKGNVAAQSPGGQGAGAASADVGRLELLRGRSGRVIGSTPSGIRTDGSARTPSATASSPFKSAVEQRGVVSSGSQSIRTPVQSSPRRDSLRTAPGATVPGIRQPATAENRRPILSTIPSQRTEAPSPTTPGGQAQLNRSIELPKRIETRQIVPSNRGFRAAERQGPTLVPSRPTSRYQNPSLPTPVPAPPARVITPSTTITPPSVTRRELQKPPTTGYTQKELASPFRAMPQRPAIGAPTVDRFNSRSIRSVPQASPPPQRSIAPSYPSPSRRAPSPGITTVPSTRSYSAPPTAIRPSQVTPSVRSAPRPATASPSRGRGRSEIQK